MKKFLILVSIFSIPFIFWFLFIFIIDPYNFYNYSRIIDNSTKFKVLNRSEESAPRGNLLWKTLNFKRNSYRNLLIGDSQAYEIKEEYIKEISGKTFYNFCVPGCNLETKASIFWYSVGQTKLDHVIMELSFPNWKLNNEENLFHFAQDYIDKPYLYLSNSAIFKDAIQNLYLKITGNHKEFKSVYSFPITQTKNELFISVLERTYKNYEYPDKYIDELKKIVIYCNANNILLEFLILPIHQTYYDYLITSNLIHFNEKFISDLSLLAKTYNFSTDQEINKDENNFIDYLHSNQNMLDSITKQVWMKNNQ